MFWIIGLLPNEKLQFAIGFEELIIFWVCWQIWKAYKFDCTSYWLAMCCLSKTDLVNSLTLKDNLTFRFNKLLSDLFWHFVHIFVQIHIETSKIKRSIKSVHNPTILRLKPIKNFKMIMFDSSVSHLYF